MVLTRAKSVKLAVPSTLLSRLQDAASAYSADAGPNYPREFAGEVARYAPRFIPFQLGAIWTIASDTCQVPNAKISSLTPAEALPPDKLFQVLLSSLSEKQVQLAGGSGLSFRMLRASQEKLLLDIFHGSVGVTDLDAKAPGGSWTFISDWKTLLERSTFRVHSGFHWVEWPDEERAPAFALDPPGRFRLQFPVDPTSVFTGYRVSPFTTVPARLKPQALPFDSPTFAKPVGVRGLMPLSDLIKGVNSRLGLSLHVDTRLESKRVFIGDPSLLTGAVLKAVAFDIQGAWRKVGAEYFLALDAEGENSVNMRFIEAMAPVERANQAYAESMRDNGHADAMKRCLAPDPLAPVGFTDEQVKSLRSRMTMNRAGRRSAIRFSDLEASQQDAIIALTSGKKRYGDGKVITPDLLATAVLTAPKVECSINFEDLGLVSLGTYGSFPVAIDADPPQAKSDAPAIAEARAPPEITMLEVGALGPAHWDRLFVQCKRKGINTVFVPVLWDGQVPFASKYFPRADVAKGKDLLQTILDTAKERGIRVIGTIHALAWRLTDSSVHWLSNHPELVDIDCQGHTRRQWVEAGSPNAAFQRDAQTLTQIDPVVLSDFVQPANSEVEVRLSGLVRELARYRGLYGLALDHWSRVAGRGYNSMSLPERSEAAPSLGYSDRDRLAFIHAAGVDPVDLVDEKQGYLALGVGSIGPDTYTAWRKRRFGQDAGLAQKLISEMEKVCPKRVYLFNYLGRLDEGPLPTAEYRIDWQLASVHREPPVDPEDALSRQARQLMDVSGILNDAHGKVDGGDRVLNLAGHDDTMWDILQLLPDAGTAATGQR